MPWTSTNSWGSLIMAILSTHVTSNKEVYLWIEGEFIFSFLMKRIIIPGFTEVIGKKQLLSYMAYGNF